MSDHILVLFFVGLNDNLSVNIMNVIADLILNIDNKTNAPIFHSESGYARFCMKAYLGFWV